MEARAGTLRLPSPGEDTEGWLSPLLSLRKNAACQTGSGLQPGSSLLCHEFTSQESQTLVAPPGMNSAATWSAEAPSPLTHFLHNLQSHDDPQREMANVLQASSGWKKAPAKMFILPKWPWRSRGNCHWGPEWVLNARCQFCGWGMRGGRGQLRSLSWLTRCTRATPCVNPKCESQRASVYTGHGSALFSVVLHNPSDCLNTSREHLENKCSCMRTCKT